ncbi:FadR/GntR family transcriptional regulator [Thalassospira sp. MCCC 1A01428]|uniref:FadR/GntR family transcriptional regulator n=1 Tax=Thalassospira sp. MCCC 1A01428 TaxID=1470575 RepID=UPI000A1FB160|nr:FadR/GntR family transcriptional regulator [Thalassospira sp. MCCC 1A01428]
MAANKTSSPTPKRIIAPQRLFRQIADALEERIVAGEFQAGDRLPTERELSSYYSVSRTSVREALLTLEIAGLVSIRVGSGVYVLSPDVPEKSAITEQPDLPGLEEILGARLMFEPEICAAAASNATAEDIARIAATLDVMRDEHRNAAETERGDREFHHAISQACGNTIAQDTLKRIWESMNSPLWQNLQRHIRSPILRLKWIEDHEAIFAAIRDKDRTKARSTMRQHIKHVIDNLNRTNFR